MIRLLVHQLVEELYQLVEELYQLVELVLLQYL
jgi:hypothetical protein